MLYLRNFSVNKKSSIYERAAVLLQNLIRNISSGSQLIPRVLFNSKVLPSKLRSSTPSLSFRFSKRTSLFIISFTYYNLKYSLQDCTHKMDTSRFYRLYIQHSVYCIYNNLIHCTTLLNIIIIL